MWRRAYKRRTTRGWQKSKLISSLRHLPEGARSRLLIPGPFRDDHREDKQCSEEGPLVSRQYALIGIQTSANVQFGCPICQWNKGRSELPMLHPHYSFIKIQLPKRSAAHWHRPPCGDDFLPHAKCHLLNNFAPESAKPVQARTTKCALLFPYAFLLCALEKLCPPAGRWS